MLILTVARAAADGRVMPASALAPAAQRRQRAPGHSRARGSCNMLERALAQRIRACCVSRVVAADLERDGAHLVVEAAEEAER